MQSEPAPPPVAPGIDWPSPVAMVLAAGFGTRLRPLTHERPKPLVPIGDRSLLHHVLERLHRAGIARVVLNTHHNGEVFDALMGEGPPVPLPLERVHEPRILGTAGGVHNAAARLGDGPVLLWNGDILAEVDLAALFAVHRASGAVATLAVRDARAGDGTVGVDGAGRVVRLRDERYAAEAKGCDFVGVQVVSAQLRRDLVPEGCLVADALQPALRAGALVQTASVVAQWTDVGTLGAYARANQAWLRARGLDSWIGAGASIGPDVTLHGSVIGVGATVSGAGELRRCVIWPGARAVAPLVDSVVTCSGLVAHAPCG